MSIEFTVLISVPIQGEIYTFERTLPLDNDFARILVGKEIEDKLDEFYKIYTCANLISGLEDKE
jgi:hypothetical protein